VDEKDNFERRLIQSTEHLLATQRQLEDNLAHFGSEQAELVHRLEESGQEVDRLEHKLQEAVDNRARETELHNMELQSASERYQLTESVRAQLHEEIATVQGRLEHTRVELQSLQEEKVALQVQITTLEAEGQRSISLGRFLESKVKERYVRLFSLDGSYPNERENQIASARLQRSKMRFSTPARTCAVPRNLAKLQKSTSVYKAHNTSEKRPSSVMNYLPSEQGQTSRP
jgi:myosin protein heavy chain